MLQHVLKWAAIAAIWRQARPYLLGTVVAILGMLLVSALHAEFVDYIRLSKDLDPDLDAATTGPGRWLLASFMVKWTAFMVLATGWLLYARKVFTSRQRKPTRADKASLNKQGAASADAARGELTPAEQAQQLKDDQAFDFLREKRKLEGRGDKILKGKLPPDSGR